MQLFRKNVNIKSHGMDTRICFQRVKVPTISKYTYFGQVYKLKGHIFFYSSRSFKKRNYVHICIACCFMTILLCKCPRFYYIYNTDQTLPNVLIPENKKGRARNGILTWEQLI